MERKRSSALWVWFALIPRPGILPAVVLLLLGQAAISIAGAQTLDSGFVYGGVTFGKRLEGAGRFGIGLDFRLTDHLDLGGEVGTIHKNDVGILGSGNLTYHFTRPRGRRRDQWDPFLVGGVSGARISGTSGLYLNLGGGVNYWLGPRWASARRIQGLPRRSGPGRLRRVPLRRDLPALSGIGYSKWLDANIGMCLLLVG